VQYLDHEQCNIANGTSRKVAEQKTPYEKSLLALQNKRCAPHYSFDILCKLYKHMSTETVSPYRVGKLFYECMINANEAFKSQFRNEDIDVCSEHIHARQSAEEEATLTGVPPVSHETMKRHFQDENKMIEALQHEKSALL
jgi:hypothetical protein